MNTPGIFGFNGRDKALGDSPTPILPLPGEKSEKDNAVGAHETNPGHSMLAKLIGHGQQEPAVRARHGVKRLNQPLDRLTQVHLLGHLGRRRLSLTLEEQLVGFDFQCLGEFLQSAERGRCVSAFNARDVRAQETGPPFDVALRETFNFTQLS